MKVITCDRCSRKNARSFKYHDLINEGWRYTDLCMNCVSDFVLDNKVKLFEIVDQEPPNKGIIHG